MKSVIRFTNNIRGNKCLNCGTNISEEDNFCRNCGQVNDTKRLSVKQYFSEYLSGFFEFDNRFLKTVIPLIFKPGLVTKNYIAGMRMKYVNPFQLYLHITILFFLVVGIFQTIDKFKPVEEASKDVITSMKNNNNKEVLDSIKRETLQELQNNNIDVDSSTLALINVGVDNVTLLKDTLEERKERNIEQLSVPLNAYIDSLISEPGALSRFTDQRSSSSEKDSAMADILKNIDLKAIELAKDDKNVVVKSWADVSVGWAEISKKNKLKKKGISHLDSILAEKQIDYSVPLSLVRFSAEDATDGKFTKFLRKLQFFVEYQKLHPQDHPVEALNALKYEKSYWNVFLYSKSTEMIDGFENPNSHYGDEILDRILSRISVALFFLLPVFTMIVSLLYIRRNSYNYTENLVFVFHVQTVFFLLLLIFMIINRFANSKIVIPIFLITFMIYLYKAMRTFYQQGRIKTLLKYILLKSAFMVLALIGGTIISFIAFLI